LVQLFTATIGAVLWWMATSIVDSRVAMGRGWPFVHLAVWSFVIALVVTAQRAGARTASPEHAPSLRRQAREAGADVLRMGLAAAVVAFLLGVAFGFARVGDGPSSVWLASAWLTIVSAPLVFATMLGSRWLRARRRGPTTERAEPLGVAALASAMAPLLMLSVVLWVLRHVEAPEAWSSYTEGMGRSGMLAYVQLAGLLPAALMVAWGLDRLDGSRGARPGRVLLAAAGLGFVGLALWLPEALTRWSVHASKVLPRTHGPLDGLASGVAYFRPFGATQRVGEEWTRIVLDITDLTRAGLALLFVSALATAAELVRLGRAPRQPPRAADVLAPALGLVVALVAAWVWCPRHGPSAAPWSGVAGVVVAAALGTVRHRAATLRPTA
jgi:hypothetical protein